jgi:hypothetical protein
MKGKEPQPGRLNRGRMTGSKMIPSLFINPEFRNISEATMKGRREGKTVLSQTFRPSRADCSEDSEKITRNVINATAIKGKTILLA